MRRFLFLLSLAVGMGTLTQAAPPGATCGDYGTAVEFSDSPKEAAKQAARDEKLVFVLHVSGHFEDPGVT